MNAAQDPLYVCAAFWAKARPQDGAAAMHPVIAHSLDVAAVVTLLPRPPKLMMPARTLAWVTALHDIGKFSRNFQSMVPEHWPTSSLGAPPPGGMPAGPRHDTLGYQALRQDFARRLDPVLPRDAWPGWAREPLLRAIAGHHGRPPSVLNATPGAVIFCNACRDAAATFLGEMLSVFCPEPLDGFDGERQIDALGWALAGHVTLADWVGSRQAWFPYATMEEAGDPAAYFWDRALPRAASIIAASGLSVASAAPFGGLRRLFPGLARPSPVQDWAESVALPAGPVLALVEDLTGSGKTEAALAIAHRIMARGGASGIFVALPTMATANAMFGRRAGAYSRLFLPEARPSLALAHGRADLDPRFAASIPVEQVEAPKRSTDPADEPAESHCAAWLAEDRRRALMAQIGVGTLDQALLAVLPVRHAAFRLRGLAGKVLVIDEAHAFDAYMQREMLTLLEFHAALGGSAVLLSATLPLALRQKLVDAFRKGLGARKAPVESRAYPLATLVSTQGLTETPCAPREGLPRRVAVTRLSDVEAALDRIVAAARAGAAVAWVRNTVDDAIEAADALRGRGITPLLFHARFAMGDRLAIEQDVLRRFGPNGAERAGVLVATQVIEQSLDLDFDLLVTDLAPVDLLIQRAGRLWRHLREGRPVAAPELLVVSPEPVTEPAKDWIESVLPGTVAVYRDPALLWRGARAVFARGAIATPEDMRPLIEDAFDDRSPGAVPAALVGAASVAGGKARAATDLARQNLLEFDRCWDRDAGFWEPETHTPTRLEERPQVTLRLAVVRDGKLVPYAEDDDIRRAWALSEVNVAQHRIATCPVPAGLEKAAEAARATWGRWERESDRVVLAVMQESAGAARIAARDGQGADRLAPYDRLHGLCLPHSESDRIRNDMAAIVDPQGESGEWFGGVQSHS